MKCPPHHIILASAGTGKTFALTGRILRLLAAGVPLKRIVALTFTRAAAGEIFASLVTRLAAAAEDADHAAEESRRLGLVPSPRHTDYADLLAAVLAEMHVSPIGTLDSFFVRMVRLFPFEFGLNGDFTVLTQHAVTMEMQQILRDILTTEITAENPAFDEFVEAFKRATFGAEEKRLHDLLGHFVRTYHNLYLNAVATDGWGNAQRMWQGKKPWWHTLDDKTRTDTVQRLRELVLQSDPTEAQWERWETFFTMAERFEPGSMVTKPGHDIFHKLLEQRDTLDSGTAQIVVQRRRVTLSRPMGQLAHLLSGHILACLVKSRLQTTRGIAAFLARYEAEYDARVRRAGKLTFADVSYVIGRAARNGAPTDIEFRLDGRYDHWAIDEFQDTSRRQWAGIAPLVDEVLQDAEGQRSFFAVGDVKQAIYGWRGGDSTLLNDIGAYYGIEASSLTQSYRCGPEVIQAVNAVFGNLPELISEGLPAPVVDRWSTLWKNHSSAREETSGAAALLEVRAEDGMRPKAADWHRDIAETLLEIEPWKRNMSTAVLVRSNCQGEDLTRTLRGMDIPAVWTGTGSIADNPAVAAMLDLFLVAEHPGDTFAWEHLHMTPFADILATHGWTTPGKLAETVLRDLHEEGFAAVVETWTRRLAETIPLDAFARRRLRSLLDAAELFDRTANRSCLDFVESVRLYTVADIAAEHTVQIMTIHRSKGLGFDVVLLPLFPGSHGLGTVDAKDVLSGEASGPAGEREWVLLAPDKLAALADEVLAEALVRASQEKCFEELCVLYVAMTRAKRGLYLFVPPVPKRRGALHAHTLVRRQLTRHADGAEASPLCFGHARWYEARPRTPPIHPAEEAETGKKTFTPGGTRRRFPRRTPSHRAWTSGRAADLFMPASTEGLHFGTLIHSLMQEIRWWSEEPFDQIAERWQRGVRVPEALARRVITTVRKALEAPEIRRELQQPEKGCTLWRERSFELILDGEWISGTFDRVTFGPADSSTRPAWARITDFKSDRIGTAEELTAAVQRYAGQLDLYRRALAALVDLPESMIETRLLFTDAACVRTVPP